MTTTSKFSELEAEMDKNIREQKPETAPEVEKMLRDRFAETLEKSCCRFRATGRVHLSRPSFRNIRMISTALKTR